MKNILLFSILLCSAANMSAQCLSITTCHSNETVCDLTPNNNLLWNDNSWWDQFNQSHDLSEAPSDLFAVAVDTCSGANLTVKYTLFIDLDQDGVAETVVKSWDPPAPGTVNFNNFNNPNYDGGASHVFDQRAVPSDQKYQFALETIAVGDTLTGRLRWNTQADPNTFVVPELPYSYVNKIKWEFEDNLANLQVCNNLFIVKDCKAPTVTCLNGLSTNVYPGGGFNLQAIDLLQYADDNSTLAPFLRYGIRKSGTGTGFPVDAQGNPITSIFFVCPDQGLQNIELWAIDLYGNADFCETYVLVQDNAGYCDGTISLHHLVCIRRACDNAMVMNVQTGIWGPVTFAPPFSYFSTDSTLVNVAGCYSFDSTFNSFPIPNTINISVSKDDDPLNGVTPFDLLKIAKHIMGIEPLGTYNMIAADANKSNSITTFDIVELRKLIQGTYQELSANTSWRFVDAAYTFPNPANPFQSAFPGTSSFSNLIQDSIYVSGFIAIKIGDVDCDANPGAIAPPDDRQVKFLSMPDAVLAPGETIEIPLSFTEAGDWVAMQLGLQYDPSLLEIEAIVLGNFPDLEESSFASPSPGILNLVWFTTQANQVIAHEKIFTLHLRAKQNLQLSQTLQLTQRKPETPRRLQAEAYDARGTAFNFELLFRENEIGEASNQNLVYQPQPNPTNSKTTIPIQLIQEETVRIAVTDVSGKLLWGQELMLGEGLQMLDIPAAVLSKAGVYFWRVEAGSVVASGKVIRV